MFTLVRDYEDRSLLFTLIYRRWDHFAYGPAADGLSPNRFLADLARSEHAWVWVAKGQPKALFWLKLDSKKDRIPLLHVATFGGSFFYAWHRALEWIWQSFDVDGVVVCGISSQTSHFRWLSRLPYGNIYEIPLSRTDPVMGCLCGYWEYVLLQRDYQPPKRRTYRSQLLLKS